MLEEVKKRVEELFINDKSGHGMDHIRRVVDMSTRFAKDLNANLEIVTLASFLHDVDDYKIVGKDNAQKYLVAAKIMNDAHYDEETINKVIDIIKSIGFSKSLKGIRPTTLEGMIVSDADMCDALGTMGIIRAITYAVSDKGTGVIFDKNIFPICDIDAEVYTNNGTNYGEVDTMINHTFDKILKLKGLMLTESGKKEAIIRHEFIISFLKEFFREENVPEWTEFLNKYLENLE